MPPPYAGRSLVRHAPSPPIPASRPPPSWALLVQGDVSVRLRRAWPLGAGLPEPTLPRPRRGPGTAAVLRVPPLQGLPRVQAERDWDDRQQADVPGAGQQAASAEMPSEGTPLLLLPQSPSLLFTRDSAQPARLQEHPLRTVFSAWVGAAEVTSLPSPALAPQPSSVTDTGSHHCHVCHPFWLRVGGSE